MNELRIPSATYRLQFHREFKFTDATDLVAYLHDLGISDVYASPVLTARPGSMHGYDVIDHSRLNPEIGTREEFNALSDQLRDREMGLVMDVVPNHMGIDDPENMWWRDVLENGPSSPYAMFFDIDWAPPKHDLRNRVLLPILGDQYGKVLENGEIQLQYADGGFFVAYYQRRFPLDPRSSRTILELALDHVRYVIEPQDPDLIELESIVTALGYLPERSVTEPDKVEERQREKEVAKRRLSRLAEDSGPVRRAIEAAVEELNGQRGDAASFDRLEKLLADQAYRLCYWRVAADEINYRRFFDINELAAIRVEEPEVFQAVHQVVLELVSEGRVSGIRIDHPDGLFDPERYFLELQARSRAAITGAEFVMPKLTVKGLDCAVYVAVEKILSHDERLPERWAVHGTSGYEILNLINGIFVDPRDREQLEQFYNSQIWHRRTDFDHLVYECKKLILGVSMSSELHVLARRLDRISEQHRWSRDFTFWSLHEALSEVVACFPVYRSYIRADSTAVSEEDRRHIESAVRSAKRLNPATDPSVFDFIGSVLLLEDPEDLSDSERAKRRNFVMRIQQLTGPVMAKGFEDTAFYRAYPLASLNEVGGEPQLFGGTLEDFHDRNLERLKDWPYGMSASSTHDTKRSEDVRARINALSEIVPEWVEAVTRWQAHNRDKKTIIERREVPDSNEEYLLYQILIGAWPLEEMDDDAYGEFVRRIVGYMEKALKEAKVHTSWVNPNTEYDKAVGQFVQAVLTRGDDNHFLKDLLDMNQRIAQAGMFNALSQLLVKMTIPGVPDFYQGTELWNLTLVDPDNRRPVDYPRRMELLNELRQREQESVEPLIDQLVSNWKDGRIKLFVTHKGLNYRRQSLDLFLNGSYLVPEVTGQQREHVVTYARGREGKAVLVVVPRWVMRLASPPLGEQAWSDTTLKLPEELANFKRWRNIYTGETLEATSESMLPLQRILARFPIALLDAEQE